MAVQVGQVLAAWRRRRAVAKQDAFVLRWKTAWAEGYRHARQGLPTTAVPYVQDDQRAAWHAGWQWAASHPTPDHMMDRGTDPGDRRARLARGARRGITGLVLVAAARWWWRRRAARTGAASLEAMNDAEP
jgi:ribosome modulation factor